MAPAAEINYLEGFSDQAPLHGVPNIAKFWRVQRTNSLGATRTKAPLASAIEHLRRCPQ
jgi:hypothetical protein